MNTRGNWMQEHNLKHSGLEYVPEVCQIWRKGTPEPRYYKITKCQACLICRMERIDHQTYINLKAAGAIVRGIELVNDKGEWATK